ncbi:hypothetical protein [Klebsiella pneumoniae]|uniref:hypothetical protein n=1 Tax=Klebsiella sp. JB_Kp021 TaxID=3153373 RepID=UPI003003F18E
MANQDIKVWTLFKEVGRKTGLVLDNHYFMIIFLFIVLFLGTISIWFDVIITTKPGRIDRFLSNMQTLNLVAFSAPLLATTIFDKLMMIALKARNKELDDGGYVILCWLILSTVIVFVIIGLLFGIGSTNKAEFSVYSFIAFLISIYFWMIANIENPNYKLSSNASAASGGSEEPSSELLKRGIK